MDTPSDWNEGSGVMADASGCLLTTKWLKGREHVPMKILTEVVFDVTKFGQEAFFKRVIGVLDFCLECVMLGGCGRLLVLLFC